MSKSYLKDPKIAAAQMKSPPDFEYAAKKASGLAYCLGVRAFLYRDATGYPVYRVIQPADWDEGLELVQTFEPPPRTIYEGQLPPTPEAAS